MSLMIEKLTELLIKQDIKDKKMGKKELISKVGAYKSLIDFLKEVNKYEKDINNNCDAIDSITYFTSENLF